ncbi:MAG: toll/interleukin-1 receptor domain-containing protein [Verrucomicrobia bacterium]|nr:toll/interleukin-1 receptor domain-containing protein [Verrucomicrobiota bacterium]
MSPQEVFLSHASPDLEFTERLAAVMRRHGVPVWFSRTHILGGQQWHDEIGSALRRCDWFVVVLSTHALHLFWVKRELFFALQQERFVNRIVPVLSEPCEYENLSWTLASFQLVDFSRSFETGCRDLLRTWSIAFQSL